MDETQIISTAATVEEEEEEIGDDFYEKIEAPKFVDLTAPDRCRTEHDDRYWFCLRVGCDQRHEEELDSEAIYKDFVLRVMEARSPSVRFRKKNTSLQCPRTVPAKPSKSRVSKLAMISSVSMGEAEVKVKPVPKQNASTPNVKAAKQPSTRKALTTPSNKKRVSNPGTFRSVRNPKLTTIEAPKTRGVAKALVFHSPKKAVKLKKSVEWSSSLRNIRAGMKKLEISDGNKKNALGSNKPLDASRKVLKGREVRSRVYDYLHSQNQKNQEAKSSKCLKKKNKDTSLQLSKGTLSREGNEKDSTQKEIEAIDEKVKISPDNTLNSEEMNSGDNDVPKSQTEMLNETRCNEDNVQPCLENRETPDEAVVSDDKENALASHTKVSESEVIEIDDKENESASDENRKLNRTEVKLVKKDILGKHDTSKSTQKATKATSKTLKENSASAANSAQGMKYRKPKPTNPKPFRFRTDERGILKEANLEKKHVQAPLKETTTTLVSQAGNSLGKHQNVQRKEKCLGQLVRPRGGASSKKKMVSIMKPSQQEISDPDEERSSSAKPSASNASRPSPLQRRHTTVPKEPNFHHLHVPKSCTRRVL